jgi:type I restriction enzyme S subunit
VSGNLANDNNSHDSRGVALPPLPNGWKWTTLEVISDIEGGITKDQKRKRTDDCRQVPYLRVANVQRGYFDLKEIKTITADESEIESLRLQAGDILFTEGGDRDKLGRGWVWNDEIPECIHQNHIFRARPKSDDFCSKFISFHGNFFGQDWFTRTGKQTTNLASINKSVLKRFPVPVAPANEQRRIVAKIEELFSDLDAGVAALGRAKINLKRYRAAVLKAAVEGKLTAAWRAEHKDVEPASELLKRIASDRRRKWEQDQFAKFAAAGKPPPKKWQAKYVEPSPPDTADFSRLPPHWCWTTLGELKSFAMYGPRFSSDDYSPTGKLVLRTTDFSPSGQINFETPPRLPLDEKTFNQYKLEAGDLLVTRTGSLGTLAVFQGGPDSIAGAFLIYYRLPVPLTMVWYVFNFLKSPRGQRQLIGKGAGVGRPNLNMPMIDSIPIPFPPALEQEAILAEIGERRSQTQAAEAAIDHSLARAARLRQSILKRAFSGQLVPQDPHDEPAGSLLARIHAANDSAEPMEITGVGLQNKRKEVKRGPAKSLAKGRSR